jgi:hypothetical protein
MSAPVPKWVYDTVIELLYCKAAGTQPDLDTLITAVPGGMLTACQGIIDYHGLSAATAPAFNPSAAPVTPVIPLQDAPLQQVAGNGMPA